MTDTSSPTTTDPAAAPSGEPAVAIRGLEHRYGDRQALAGIDVQVAPGAVHAFLGPNGSGKSTLFKVLATLLAPQRGSASLLGHDLGGDPAAVRRRIGVVFQSPALDKKLSVRANLQYAGLLQGLSGRALGQRIDELLDAADLTDRVGDKVEGLSGGLRRRVEIVKALLHRPEVLLLDEPSTGLDPAARRDFWRLLRSAEPRPTILFTTHLMDEAEAADRITLLHEGRVVAEGTPDELQATVGGEVLEAEVGDPDAAVAALRELGAEDPQAVGSRVRVRQAGAHKLVGPLLDRLGDAVSRVSVARPSLEDVFFERTGSSLGDEAERTEEKR